MNGEQEKNYVWEYFYMLCLTFMPCLLPFLCYRLPYQFMAVIVIITIIGFFIVWKRKLSKKLLYFNNILLLLVSVCIAYFIIYFFVTTTDRMIGIILGVAAWDVYSFTKSGRNTLNAKLIGNTNSLARLSICLPVPKKPGLQPILGVGDLNYYSLITMFTIKSTGITGGLIALFVLFTGQLANILSISVLRERHWLKGFPATLFPGLLYILATILHIL